jgi:hypothetical protein
MEDPTHLRALFDHLLRRYAWLANTFAMLTPLVKESGLKDRLAKSNKLLPASPVARALFNSCVVDVHVLLRGDEDKNPSLLRLVRPLLLKNRPKNTALLDQLASLLYSKNANLRRKFRNEAEGWANDLTADWGQLQETAEQFLTLRNKWIAHQEVEWDPATGSFRGLDPALAELFPELEMVIQVITRSVANLARILLGREIKQTKFSRQLRENAIIFWDLK